MGSFIGLGRRKLGARFHVTEGLMHIEQSRESIQAVSNYLRKVESPYMLAALHTITTLTGSALIALAFSEGKIDSEHAWKIAHLDEKLDDGTMGNR